MEFNEKLQELRKSRGLTQEELAKEIYVSRTAISKWESGRGYPSIDSLKALSAFFSVTVDDLISGEKIVYIAENENRSNIRALCHLMFGGIDLMTVFLILLPLYPKAVDAEITAVNLFAYTQLSPLLVTIHWILYGLLTAAGIVMILLTQLKKEKGQRIVGIISVVLGVITVFFLALTRESYATITAFFLLIVKVFLLFRSAKKQ